MKILKAIKIAGCVYSVDIVDRDLLIDGRKCSSIINYQNHEILINKDSGDKQSKMI